MKRTIFTAITFFAVSVARASDIATTFHFDPSLSREANPLVAQFGAGGRTMVVANLIGMAIFLFLPLLAYWRGRPKELAVRPRNIWDFAALYLYDRAMSRGRLLRAVFLCWPLPKDWLQVLRLCGLMLPWGVVAGSLAAVFSWWALSAWHWSAYHSLYKATGVGGYPISLLIFGIPGFIFGAVMFFRLEYADHLRTNV